MVSSFLGETATNLRLVFIDPETFDLDDLRTSEIEIISELEDGYIIGASADTNFTTLQDKIEKFFNEQKGGGVIAKILNIIDKNQRPEFILSSKLLQEWDQIKDEQVYIVSVKIAVSIGELLNHRKEAPKHQTGFMCQMSRRL
ncbi:MAG: hypothetical protein KME52_12765 [Desmonostoc geniculatum HA4340-LM1]|jgi:hypothetical protein|nr:hypothetical protein [Desmonostoc geniculatum HA4340-LM1]